MRMALALNNLKRVDMPLNKETKPFKNEITINIFTYKSYVYPFICEKTNDL